MTSAKFLELLYPLPPPCQYQYLSSFGQNLANPLRANVICARAPKCQIFAIK